MADRIITFQYAKDNYDTYKKQTIPSSNECMTKNDVIAYINCDETLFSSYVSNRLIPRNKVVGILYTPTIFGPYNGGGNSQTYLPGYQEYNDIFNSSTYFNAFRLTGSGIRIGNGSQIITLSIDSRGNNFIQSLITKAKELSNWSSLTGWTLTVKISGIFYYNTNESNGVNNSVDYFLYDSSYNKISTGNINTFISETIASSYHLRYKTTILSSGFTPNRINTNNQISNHTKLDLDIDQYYKKPNDPYDTQGFENPWNPNDWAYNTEYFYFGKRQVMGGYGDYESAPSGTPNFPRPGGVNGAMNTRYYFVAHSVKIEFRATNGSTTIDIGSFNITLNDNA